MGNFVPATPGRDQTSRAVRIVKRVAVVVLVVACIVALAYLVLTHVTDAIDSSFDEREHEMALSERTVLASLNSTSIASPDLSGYSLVEKGNLIGPRFENVSVGELQETATSDSKTGDGEYREVTSTAKYRNSSVSVDLPLTQRFTYDADTTSWVGGEIDYGTPKVTPLRAPSLTSIEAELPSLLAAYDASLASRMEDFGVTFDSAMDEGGGKVTAKLSKNEGAKVLTCNVDLWVSWSDSQGWQVTVTSASAVKETVSNAAGSSSSPSSASSSASSSVLAGSERSIAG